LFKNGFECNRVAIYTQANSDFAIWLIDWSKERVTLNVIPMTVTKKKEEGLIVLNHPDPQFTNTCACIKDDIVAAV
jgi:hypothetical protein